MDTPLVNQAFSHLDGVRGDAAVLLIHGLGGGPYEVQRLGEKLAEQGFGVAGITLPGHAPGPARMPASRWEDWDAAAKETYATLLARFRTVHLVGFSTGATLSLKLAGERLLRGKFVLLAPFIRVYKPLLLPVAPERLVRTLAFLHDVPSRAPPMRDRVVQKDIARCSTFRTHNLDATRSALELIALAVAGAGNVNVPSLVVQGANDTVVDPEGARELMGRLPEPTRLLWVEGSDHLVTMDVGRPFVEDAICRFLGDEGEA